MSGLRSGSACSGYGGLDMAVDDVFGSTPAWFFEYEKAPSKILAHHWPDVPNYGDLTKARWDEIEQVKVMCAGTPCQDLSGAGKRKGMNEGTRSNLWVAYREGIAIQRPEIVVWENVRGAYSAYANSEVESEPGLLGEYGPTRPALNGLGRVLGDLASLGYDSEWVGLRASDVGAPHERYRVFVVAVAQSVRHEWAGRAWNGRHGFANSGYVAANAESHAGRIFDGDGVFAADAERLERVERHGCSEVGRRPGEAEQAWLGHSGTDWGIYAPAIARWESVTGHRAPAPTKIDGKSGKPRLAPEFGEWMMGQKPGHITSPEIGLTRTEQLKAIGNGVVTQQAKYAITLAASRLFASRIGLPGKTDERTNE